MPLPPQTCVAILHAVQGVGKTAHAASKVGAKQVVLVSALKVTAKNRCVEYLCSPVSMGLCRGAPVPNLGRNLSALCHVGKCQGWSSRKGPSSSCCVACSGRQGCECCIEGAQPPSGFKSASRLGLSPCQQLARAFISGLASAIWVSLT